MDRSCHERGCDPPYLQALGMLGGALLIVLFVRLLHDPHVPPRLYGLTWLTAVVVMGRLAFLGAKWLVGRSPAALPEQHTLRDALARTAIWLSFGCGLLMSASATLGLVARLGGPGHPPPPPPPPAPPVPPDLAMLLHHGGPGPGPAGPGIFLGLALVFVPTVLLCLALSPLARRQLQERELWTPLDAEAARAGLVLAAYGLGFLWLLLSPGPERLKHDLLQLFSPAVLPDHAIACAASFGAWKTWFLARRRLGWEAPPPPPAAP